MYSREKIIETMKDIVKEGETIKPYVVIAQPRRDLKETPAQRFNGFDMLHVDIMGYTHGFCNIGGEKVDVARNYLIEQVIESDAKYMFFIGEDTVVPYQAFTKLHEIAEKNPDAVVAGVYYVKMSSPMIHVKENNYIKPANVDPGQVYEALSTGMDCVLIPVSILKAMKGKEPELPFCCIGYNIPDIPFIGEDMFFYFRLRRLGYRLLINTDVQCLHVDLASGKFTAHPSITPERIKQEYFTNIPITEPLTIADKEYIDKRWTRNLEKSTEKTVEEKGA